MSEFERNSVGVFIGATLERAYREAATKERFLRTIGPLKLDVRFVGLPDGGGATADRLLRYASRKTGGQFEEASVVIAGPGSPLGAPPACWPFPLTDANAFNNTHWDPARGIALASDARNRVWNLADLKNRRYLYWINDPEALPPWEYSAPLRHVVHWCALQSGSVLAHMAVFGRGGVFVGLTGPSGAGKSTTAAAAMAAGMDLLAEDLCWISERRDRQEAIRTFDVIKLTDDTLERFPQLRSLWYQFGTEKLEKNILRIPTSGAESARIRALFCLSGKFADRAVINPCSKVEAFRLLAPSTVFLMRTAAREVSARLKTMIDRVPIYEAIPGPDPVETAEKMLLVASRQEAA